MEIVGIKLCNPLLNSMCRIIRIPTQHSLRTIHIWSSHEKLGRFEICQSDRRDLNWCYLLNMRRFFYFCINCHRLLTAFRGTLLEQTEQLECPIYLEWPCLINVNADLAAVCSSTTLTPFMNVSYRGFGNKHKHIQATMLQLLQIYLYFMKSETVCCSRTHWYEGMARSDRP